MSVTTTHVLYNHYIHKVREVRDVLEGTDAIVAHADRYVPPLKKLTKEENDARVRRPSFDNFTDRTLDGFTGLVFSKSPGYEVPSQLEDLFNNIDLENKTMTDIAQIAVDEVLTTGRVGILVDVKQSDIKEEVSEVLVEQNRPYLTMYPTESIINWRIEDNKLVMVVLKESKQVWTSMFESEYVDIYRVLYIDQDGKYTVDVYELDHVAKKANKQNDEPIKPIQNGSNMEYIPFVSITPNVLDIRPHKPPLYALADANVSYHRLKVDLYHGLFFTMPTPYGKGIQSKEALDINLGSTTMHLFNNPNAELSYLEFTGQGLGHYFTEMEKCKETMGSLGAEFLRNESSKVEATETVQIRNSADRATLISVATTVSRGLELALTYMAKWLNVNDDITYALNTDFNLTKMTAQEVTALTNSWLSGMMSKYDVYYNLKRGERIEDGVTFEEWSERLEMVG